MDSEDMSTRMKDVPGEDLLKDCNEMSKDTIDMSLEFKKRVYLKNILSNNSTEVIKMIKINNAIMQFTIIVC